MSQLPALQFVLPLLSAPICVLLRRASWARVYTTLVCLLTFLIAVALYAQVEEHGALSYHIGGWRPPYGIELRVDAVTVLILLVVTAIATVVVFTGIGDQSHGVPENRQALFYSAYLLCLTGLVGMTVTGDAFNVFVCLEISSLSTYTLIAMGRQRRAVKAAISYLMMGTVGGTFILLGIGMLYQMTGSLNMADLATLLPAVKNSRTLLVAFSFLMVGIGLKVAVFPLHQWLPNAYAYAPSAASAFVAGTGTKVIYYLMIRFAFTVFGASLVFETLGFRTVLMPLSVVAMFAGSLAAIYQKDFKRLLAYSSVAQLGYLTLAVSLGTEAGLKAGLVHVVNHAVMKAGLFLVAAAVVAQIGSAKLSDMRGLAKKMPMTMAAMVVGGLGLIGVPGTAGFISKWYLVVATLDAGYPYLAGIILLSSLLAVVYVWRLIEIVYFQKPSAPFSGKVFQGPDGPATTSSGQASQSGSAVADKKIKAVPAMEEFESPGILIPAWTLMAASIYFGLFTQGYGGLASEAAARLAKPPAEQIAAKEITGHGPARQHGAEHGDSKNSDSKHGEAKHVSADVEHQNRAAQGGTP